MKQWKEVCSHLKYLLVIDKCLPIFFSFSEGEEARDVVVEIERATRKKPFIGGYKHKQSGVEYHHASAQTMKKQPPPSLVPKYCRDTQTVEQKHQVQQTTNDMSTQMTKIGVFISNNPDKLMTPGKYTTADDHHYMILQRVSHLFIKTSFLCLCFMGKYVYHTSRYTKHDSTCNSMLVSFRILKCQ